MLTNTLRYISYSRVIVFSLLSLSILQCKQGSQTIPVKVSAAADGSGKCVFSFGLVDPFNLGPLVKIDASKLQVEAPTYVTMDYVDNQKTILLQVTPVSSDDPQLYADYVAYKITDSSNRECLSGQTGSSLFAEIYLPPTCPSGVLNLHVQGCAISSRLEDPNVACGPTQSVPYSNEANSRATSLGSVLSLAQENEKEIGLIAKWLASRANTFLNKIGMNPGNLSSSQQTIIALAQLFSRQQSDFAEIFSGSLYTQLQAAIQEQTQSTDTNSSTGTKLHLAEDSSNPCPEGSVMSTSTTSDSSAAQAQINADLGKAETTVDLKSILQSARDSYGATGNSASLADISEPTDTDSTTSSEILNKAQTVDMMKSSPVGTIVGGVLIGVSVLWGVYYVAKTALKSRAAAKRAVLLGDKPQLQTVDENGKVVSVSSLKTKHVRWWNTADGQSKIFSYQRKRQILVQIDDKPTYKIVPAKQLNLKVEKAHWYSYTKEAIPKPPKGTAPTAPGEAAPKTQEPFKVDKTAAENQKVSTTDALKKNLKPASVFHVLGAGSLIAAGVALLVLGQTGANLVEETTDAYKSFVSDMIAAQTAIQKLRDENDTLQEAKTGLVLNKLTGTP